ncbi:deSI-like protein isoform X2 [Tanacetum coccineum]
MGIESPSSSSSSNSSERNMDSDDTQVFLNVYDLTPVNHYSIWFGVGIFHSGIQVFYGVYWSVEFEFWVSRVSDSTLRARATTLLDSPES